MVYMFMSELGKNSGPELFVRFCWLANEGVVPIMLQNKTSASTVEHCYNFEGCHVKLRYL